MRDQHTALQMRHPVQNRPYGHSMGMQQHCIRCNQTPILPNALCPFMTGFHQDCIYAYIYTLRMIFLHIVTLRLIRDSLNP